MRIEVGYGLEGALPDITAKRIIADTITPLFRQGEIYAGVNAGLQQIMRVADGEPLPPPDRKWQGRGRGENFLGFLPVLFFVIMIGGAILRRIFGRTLGAVATGGLTGGLVWLLSHIIPFAIGAGVVSLLLSLFMGIASNVRGGRTGGGPVPLADGEAWAVVDWVGVDLAADSAAAGSVVVAVALEAAAPRGAGNDVSRAQAHVLAALDTAQPLPAAIAQGDRATHRGCGARAPGRAALRGRTCAGAGRPAGWPDTARTGAGNLRPAARLGYRAQLRHPHLRAACRARGGNRR